MLYTRNLFSVYLPRKQKCLYDSAVILHAINHLGDKKKSQRIKHCLLRVCDKITRQKMENAKPHRKQKKKKISEEWKVWRCVAPLLRRSIVHYLICTWQLRRSYVGKNMILSYIELTVYSIFPFQSLWFNLNGVPFPMWLVRFITDYVSTFRLLCSLESNNYSSLAICDKWAPCVAWNAF